MIFLLQVEADLPGLGVEVVGSGAEVVEEAEGEADEGGGRCG